MSSPSVASSPAARLLLRFFTAPLWIPSLRALRRSPTFFILEASMPASLTSFRALPPIPARTVLADLNIPVAPAVRYVAGSAKISNANLPAQFASFPIKSSMVASVSWLNPMPTKGRSSGASKPSRLNRSMSSSFIARRVR